jgi:hypothetical protein
LLQKSFRNTPINFWIFVKLFYLSLVNPFTIPDITKTSYMPSNPLAYYPTVREYSKHHQDSSLVNDHQWIWISLMIPVYSRRTFVVEPQTPMSYFLCFCDSCNIRDLIIRITIPSSISLLILPFTRSVIFHPCNLVTCCNIG